ncbi:MAG: HRDC domain-containing protein [Chitinophagales bacterium]
MKVKIFTIPILHSEKWEKELNQFLQQKKVVEIDRQLVNGKNGAYWSFCVEYIDGSSAISNEQQRIDYKKVLDDATFQRYSALREVRKVLAEEEGLPVFAICSNASLSEIAKLNTITEKTMQKVKGIGEKKAAKYATRFAEGLQKKEGK